MYNVGSQEKVATLHYTKEEFRTCLFKLF